ncbi:hypothetical protein HanIR_Chr07g0300411 [Helianthus annuus]|nr:hypothetical protein HanIR_Chr07g0300411 [Helianthus annuus]
MVSDRSCCLKIYLNTILESFLILSFFFPQNSKKETLIWRPKNRQPYTPQENTFKPSINSSIFT